MLFRFPPIELFAAEGVGRRRQWSEEDKIRIVEEGFRWHRQGSATLRRYGISRSLLSTWRRAFRDGTLGAEGLDASLVPLVMKDATPSPAAGPVQAPQGDRIDIALPKGRCMTIPTPLPPSRLAALLAVVDPR